ncbi:MAG TPA: hypothetical protein VEC57_14945 [Candidatus Limnocylindrales bacterium]|nr:hypothetical protein [Candidatus Limnocylindrales bacterium]
MDEIYADVPKRPHGTVSGCANPESGFLADAGGETRAFTESIRSRAQRRAQTAIVDARRHEQFAQRITPEIETVLWCLQEAIALGYIDVHELLERRHTIASLNRF